jgi:hypothetical protein
VNNLSSIEYQNVIKDIRGVRDPAEAAFFALQPDLENAVLRLYSLGLSSHTWKSYASSEAEELVTKYAINSMEAVSDGYWNLVDFLLFKYAAERVRGGATFILPEIEPPTIRLPWHRWK